MPIIANDGTLIIELARASYDYDRNKLVAVWRLIVAGVAKPAEVTTELAVSDMLQALPQECGAMYQWIVAQSVAAGDIPAGQISA